ncbi:MAG TPA: hypothetical protein VFU15_08860 [Bacteroidia bacterium]|nr:hypothetical protein [Bacteroidia bacterium]
MFARNSRLFVASMAFIGIVAFSCKGKVEYQTVTVKDYSVDIPKHLVVATDLNDDASLQYQDPIREFYVIVIDESKDDFINTFKEIGEYDSTKTAEKNYREVQLKSMKDHITMKSDPVLKAAKINGLDAEIADFTGNVEGIQSDIWYKVAFIEGPDNMYMLMEWTKDSDKDKNSDEFDGVINSFKVNKTAAAK